MGLTGIVSGGGEGVLDLDIVSKTVAVEPFDFTTSDPISAIVPTLAACSAELTTPVSMRHLLCEYYRSSHFTTKQKGLVAAIVAKIHDIRVCGHCNTTFSIRLGGGGTLPTV